MKTRLALILVILLMLLNTLSVAAQGAGDPLAPDLGYGTPLAVVGKPLSFTPVPPTWTPPAIQPTVKPATPPGSYAAYVQAYAMLYKVPARQLFVPITFVHPGDHLTIRDVDAYWVYILDGWAKGLYIERWTVSKACCS